MINSTIEFDSYTYKHYTPVQIRYMDIDALRHVNNARYLNFLEEARLSYSHEVFDLFKDLKDLNVVVARIEIDFILPILYGQKIGIWTRVAEIGQKSFVFESRIGIEEGNSFNVASKAKQTIVYFDPTTQKSALLPSQIVECVRKFEPGFKS